MKKILIIISAVLLILLCIGLVVAYKIGLVTIPYGNVVVRNEKYGFEFSYPRNRGLYNIDEWDNDLPGSNDGGVYGYAAEGGNMGPFTDRISFSIYNTSLKKYLSKYKIKEFGWQVEDVNKFGENGKKFTNAQSIANSEAGGTVFCELLFEHKNLLYIIDCDIQHFEFYN